MTKKQNQLCEICGDNPKARGRRYCKECLKKKFELDNSQKSPRVEKSVEDNMLRQKSSRMNETTNGVSVDNHMTTHSDTTITDEILTKFDI